ncbi:MAG: BamA/TamA family outer membrane protein [Desulfovibrionaceae bacterium]|nr:BamA/TamA family outer membrane protein [Desulfovibrionaceae bacterium]
MKRFFLIWLWMILSSVFGGCEAYAETSVSPNKKVSELRYAVRFSGQDLLTDILTSNSQLLWMSNTIPDSRVALERRALQDKKTAERILRSKGYYDGTVSCDINWQAMPVDIHLSLSEGQQYVIGKTLVLCGDGNQSGDISQKMMADRLQDAEKMHLVPIPCTLDPFGARKGDPAEAERLLNASVNLEETLKQSGYPFAAVKSEKYRLYRSSKTVGATLYVDTGPLLRMGSVRVRGEQKSSEVSETYLNHLIAWHYGQYWDENRIHAYQTELMQTGLFSSIHTEAQKDAAVKDGDIVPVLLTVRDAPFQSIGGGMSFSTDNGLGINGKWEHRNLFGSGETFRISAPIMEKKQALITSFRKPAFLRRDQTFTAEAETFNESYAAYSQSAAYAVAGIERRLHGDWKGWAISGRISAEGGRIDDGIVRENYALLGLPLELRYDSTDSLLNPSKGMRTVFSVTPYTGRYRKALTFARMRADISGYFPVFENLTAAAKISFGSLTEDNAYNIPASFRFYSGGGSSVRGYKYQGIGPRDNNGDPAGGLSLTEVNCELRYRISESLSLVPFIDGGMVYEDSVPKFGKDLLWGAGMGIRYHTPIGPVRMDVAVPLQDHRHHKAVQLYFSIGQAF